jgi:ethanolamine permease
VIFTAINLFGIRESAVFNFIVTVLAIAELLIFIGIVAPHFTLGNFVAHNENTGMHGIFESLPYAVWFYLGIEGVAMVAEEVQDPNRNIPKGYIYGMLTLVLLALGVMLFSGGIGDWRLLSNIDYPLPESISMVLGKTNDWTKLFAGIGLFGLIASFHGLIIGYSRQIFALSRAGFLPAVLSKVNQRCSTPHWALIAGAVIGIITLFTGTTDKVITVSALGAVLMYAVSMLSLFRLRRSAAYNPAFRTPFYPWFPAIALVLSVVSMVAIIVYNFALSMLFFAGLAAALLLYRLTANKRETIV